MRPSDPTPLLIALIALAVAVHELQWVLLPFVLSGLVAYISTPLVEWLAGRLAKPRWVAVILVFLGILFLMSVAAFVGAPPVLREIGHAVTDFRSLSEGLAKALLGHQTIGLFGRSFDAPQLAQFASSGMQQWVGRPASVAMIGSIVTLTIFGIVVGFVLLFYFLLSGPQLIKGAIWLAPARRRPLIGEIARRMDPLLKRYFIGVIITIAYATVAAYLGLGLVLRIKHAMVLALVTGFLEIIPVFGPAASALLAGLAALRSATGIGLIIGYAIYAIALRLSIDQFFSPIALGTAARMNPAIIIFSFFTGGVLFGLVGIILAVPTALTVRVTLCVLRGEADVPSDRHSK